MTIGVPLISKNCFEGTPFLPAGAMRVPRPAAGMMTITFIRGEKYNNFAGVTVQSDTLKLSGCTPGALDGLLCEASREHLLKRPLDALCSLLNDPDLFCLLLQVGRVEDGLQRIADMVIHVGNHAYLPQHGVVLAPFVSKNQGPRQKTDQ